MGQKNTKQQETVYTPPPPDPPPSLRHPPDWSSFFLTNDDISSFLANSMPSKEYKMEWRLLYSSTLHGKSFNRFCYHVTGHGPSLGKLSSYSSLYSKFKFVKLGQLNSQYYVAYLIRSYVIFIYFTILVLISDKGGAKFGGFVDEMWKEKYSKFYGKGKFPPFIPLPL